MTSSAVFVASQLAGLATSGIAVATGVALRRRPRPYAPGSLAEAVPDRGDPVGEALRHGYAGVALRLRRDRSACPTVLRVDAPGQPLLRAAVLAPLAARVAVRGAVHEGAREPFMLLLRVPAGGYPVLEHALSEYPQIFTARSRGTVRPGPVTVVMAGDELPPGALVTRAPRRVFVEGGFDALDRGDLPAAVAPLVSEDIRQRLSWDGFGEMPAEERHLLRVLVRTAHAAGRRVRFHGLPEERRARLAYWCELRAAGVDLIGDRRLAPLPAYLRRRAGRRRLADSPLLSVLRTLPASTR